MSIDELILGKLYKTPYDHTYFIFIEKISEVKIHGHYFSNRVLVGKDCPITNGRFWLEGEEVPASEAPEYILNSGLLKEENLNYQIY